MTTEAPAFGETCRQSISRSRSVVGASSERRRSIFGASSEHLRSSGKGGLPSLKQRRGQTD
ncbi:hypothetical protein LINPERPRIM_LOCUS5355 [Linum perenne]